MVTYPADASLRGRVESIEILHGAREAVTVLPSAGAVLGIQLSGRVRAERGLLAPAGVTGIQATARRYEYLEGTSSLLVRFSALGATCLGVPASELANASVALDDLLPDARVRELHERLAPAASDADRVQLMERWLLSLPFARDRLVSHALERLDSATAEPRVGELARELAVSERQLERRFLAQVGVTPKRYASLRRFERAVELARTSGSLAAAAVGAGYYDQSHLVRDFRRFAGVAPSHYLRGIDAHVGNVQAPAPRNAQLVGRRQHR